VLPEEVIEEATEIQERHRIIDPVHAVLEGILENRTGFVWMDELYKALDLGHGKEHLRHSTRYSIAIQEVAAKLGWKFHRLGSGGRPRGYLKGAAPEGRVVDFAALVAQRQGVNSLAEKPR